MTNVYIQCDFSDADVQAELEEGAKMEPLLQLFSFAHLPSETMRSRSRRFAELAHMLVTNTTRNPERTVALRKLREAKDASITALIWKEGPS